MKSYIYFADERGKIKVFLSEFELTIINNFCIPIKKKKKGLQLYTENTFKQKVQFNGLIEKVEIITKKWWQFWK